MEPELLRYTEEHLWIAVTGATAGLCITGCAQKELKEIVSI